MVSTELIRDLMEGKKKQGKTKKFALVRTDNGLEFENLSKSTTAKVGSYQGNVGSARRSRKGRTYRAPNGSRYYVPGELDVVAYKV